MQAEKAGSRLVSVLCPFRSHTVTNYAVPTGNLDSRNSQEVITLLKSMSAKYRQTILMITHNENHADATDRVLRMTDGRLKDLGVAAR